MQFTKKNNQEESNRLGVQLECFQLLNVEAMAMDFVLQHKRYKPRFKLLENL